MATLLTKIASLVNARATHSLLRGKELAHLPCIDNAYLIIEGAEIAEYGSMPDLKYDENAFAFHFNAKGRFVLPSWCDSHTHLVFAGSRENEFVDKIKGLSYAEIAAMGGGILSSAKKVHDISEDELFLQSYERLQQVMKSGTGAIEIKSGYGLTVEGELKMLRVIQRLKAATNISIKVSFLGAHTVPAEFKHNKEGYINLITDVMLPQIAKEALADYIDVFCDQGFFTPEETEHICKAGMQLGLKPKIHANQLAVSGGVQTGIKLGALSVDHLEQMDNAAIKALAHSSTIGTLLPTAAFFPAYALSAGPRSLIDAGCAIALASDYNPGSSPSGNMNFVIAISCIQMRMLPEEAINAATINGAYAMELEADVGTITPGKKANIILTRPIPSLAYLPYSFGTDLIEKVMLAGEWL